jgi:hypothetical protein
VVEGVLNPHSLKKMLGVFIFVINFPFLLNFTMSQEQI